MGRLQRYHHAGLAFYRSPNPGHPPPVLMAIFLIIASSFCNSEST